MFSMGLAEQRRSPHSNEGESERLTRRAMLGAVLLLGSALGMGWRAARAAEPHAHHDHQAGTNDEVDAPHQALTNAALDCINSGEICANHCISLLAKGDESLAECLHSVLIMLPMTAALIRLAALEASTLQDFAGVYLKAVTECEQECRKHENHHAECKACADACAACAKECKTLV